MCYNILNEEEVPPRVRRIGGSPYDYAVRKESAKHQDGLWNASEGYGAGFGRDIVLPVSR